MIAFVFLRLSVKSFSSAHSANYSSKVGEHSDTPFDFRLSGCYLNIYLEVICIKQSQGFPNAWKVLEVTDVEAEEEGTEN